MAKKNEKIGYKPIDTAYTRDIDTWFIVLMTVVLFPVGLWLMWTRTKWKKPVKWVVTVLVLLLFLSNAVSVYQSQSGQSDPGQTAETTAAAD